MDTVQFSLCSLDEYATNRTQTMHSNMPSTTPAFLLQTLAVVSRSYPAWLAACGDFILTYLGSFKFKISHISAVHAL